MITQDGPTVYVVKLACTYAYSCTHTPVLIHTLARAYNCSYVRTYAHTRVNTTVMHMCTQPYTRLCMDAHILAYLRTSTHAVTFLNAHSCTQFLERTLEDAHSRTHTRSRAHVHANSRTHTCERTPMYTDTQACTHVRAYTNANTPIYAYVNSTLPRAHDICTYTQTFVHAWHKYIHVYGPSMGYRKKSLIKNYIVQNLLYIITLCFYHIFLLPLIKLYIKQKLNFSIQHYLRMGYYEKA